MSRLRAEKGDRGNLWEGEEMKIGDIVFVLVGSESLKGEIVGLQCDLFDRKQIDSCTVRIDRGCIDVVLSSR